MIGDGPEREKAEWQVRELGLTDCVKFFGKTNEVRRLLCMSDLFLLTSETESFGLVALEAMAAKVPVLSHELRRYSRGECARSYWVFITCGRCGLHGSTGFAFFKKSSEAYGV